MLIRFKAGLPTPRQNQKHNLRVGDKVALTHPLGILPKGTKGKINQHQSGIFEITFDTSRLGLISRKTRERLLEITEQVTADDITRVLPGL